MRELVTKAECYPHLRLDVDTDGSPDDPWLEIFIPAVSEAVAGWLKDAWRLYVPEVDSQGNVVLDSNGDPIPATDSNGDFTVRPLVKAAVLVEIASAYRYREGEGRDNVVTADAGHGYVLNKASTAILAPLRRSTLA